MDLKAVKANAYQAKSTFGYVHKVLKGPSFTECYESNQKNAYKWTQVIEVNAHIKSGSEFLSPRK